MKIKTEKRNVEITLQEWDGSGWGPDFFFDAEDRFAAKHKKEEGTNTYLCSDQELTELIEFWNDEVKAANAGKNTDPDDGCCLCLRKEEVEAGHEYALNIEEV